jgi:hypothetical protein
MPGNGDGIIGIPLFTAKGERQHSPLAADRSHREQPFTEQFIQEDGHRHVLRDGTAPPTKVLGDEQFKRDNTIAEFLDFGE